MTGVLPYVNFNPFTGERNPSDVWVQISQERGGDVGMYDAYSGKIDAGETKKEAAIREFGEESCEMFGTAETIAKKIRPMGTSGSTFMLNAEDVKSKKEIIEECSAEAYLQRKKLKKYSRGRFQEKSQVKWVKLADLVDACAHKHGHLKLDGETLQMRGYFSKNIAKQEKYLNGLIEKQQQRCTRVAESAMNGGGLNTRPLDPVEIMLPQVPSTPAKEDSNDEPIQQAHSNIQPHKIAFMDTLSVENIMHQIFDCFMSLLSAENQKEEGRMNCQPPLNSRSIVTIGLPLLRFCIFGR